MIKIDPNKAAKIDAARQIAELKAKLAETDYVGLADYDKPADDIKAQRATWREEIRRLEQI